MEYNINNVSVSGQDLNLYFKGLVDKIFAILPVYEDCEANNDFGSFHTYLDRLISELSGNYYTLGSKNFLTLTNVLIGVNNSTKINHSNVRSLTFYCISIINASKVIE